MFNCVPTFFLFTDVNECLTSNPCQHQCYNLIGSYLCQCEVGYELASDSVSCQGYLFLRLFFVLIAC